MERLERAGTAASQAALAAVRLPASGPWAHADLLTGPPRAARVLALLPAAVYLAIDDAIAIDDAGDGTLGRPRVLAVTTADAVVLPVALVVPVVADRSPWRHADVRGATVGSGAVTLTLDGPRAGHGVLRIEAARWRRDRVVAAGPAPLPAAVDRLRALLGAVPDAPPRPARAAVERLVVAVLLGHWSAALDAADGALGLGRGLTPAGDDVLSGAVLGLRGYADAPGADPFLAALVARAHRRTTTLSAALLAEAVAGRAVGPAHRLVAALRAGPAGVDGALAGLRDVGHSSGSDLAHGLLAAASAVAAAARERAA